MRIAKCVACLIAGCWFPVVVSSKALAGYQLSGPYVVSRLGVELPLSAIGDFDADGHMELVGGNPSNGLKLRVVDLSTGSLEVTDLDVPSAYNLSGTHVVDVDLDGTPEAIVITGGIQFFVLKFVGAPVLAPEEEQSGQLGIRGYPNPSNSSTNIELVMDRAALVSMTVYDVGGREVRSLFNGRQSPGAATIVWDGLDNAGNHVPSGTYFCGISLDGQQAESRKLQLLR